MDTGLNRVSRIHLPERRRNYRFALTPLADAMFQLLIFFMLSSSLTPYSLLTVQSAPGTPGTAQGQPGATETNAPASPGPVGEIVVWAIDAEAVIVGGQRFGFDALGDLTEALGASGTPADVVLVVQKTARVQDITTVLARLKLAPVGSVRISTEAD